jgi:hypothetical protein
MVREPAEGSRTASAEVEGWTEVHRAIKAAKLGVRRPHPRMTPGFPGSGRPGLAVRRLGRQRRGGITRPLASPSPTQNSSETCDDQPSGGRETACRFHTISEQPKRRSRRVARSPSSQCSMQTAPLNNFYIRADHSTQPASWHPSSTMPVGTSTWSDGPSLDRPFRAHADDTACSLHDLH